MTEPKKRRYFWLEGVTRKQVEDSLSDNRPTTLRQQRTRRLLVIATAASLLGMALVILIPNREILITISVFGGILTIVLYSQLLLSVRYLSAAPNELLDERQIKVRDACHTVAYRLLSVVGILYFIFFILTSGDGRLAYLVTGNAYPLAFSLIMCVASLPPMVLAWTMPSESPDDKT